MVDILAQPQSVTLAHFPENGDPIALTFDELIPEAEIAERFRAIAEYVGPLIANNPDKVILAPIMAGGSQVMDKTMAVASLDYPNMGPSIQPLKVSRYHDTKADAQLVVEQDFVRPADVAGKIVVFFDEVVDAGIASAWAIERATALGALRTVFVTLVRKPEAGKVAVAPDQLVVGFDVVTDDPEPAFLLGWGMDWKNKGRWLQWIGRLRDGKKVTYSEPELPVGL